MKPHINHARRVVSFELKTSEAIGRPIKCTTCRLVQSELKIHMRMLNGKGSNTRKVDVVVRAFICYEINPGNVTKIIGGNGNGAPSPSAPNPPLAGIGRSLGSGIFRENLREVATQRHACQGRLLQFSSGRYSSRQHERYHRFDPFCRPLPKLRARQHGEEMSLEPNEARRVHVNAGKCD
jgi:hypothetical protein